MSEFARETLAASHTTTVVARTATLDGFIDSVTPGGGVSLHALEPLTTIVVATRNSQYRITVSAGAVIYIQGGRFFPETTNARLDGSSAGGSFLKVAWIGVGLRMEISSGGQRIITSPVRAITRDGQPHSALTH
jgi:hypothetical protein